MSLVMRRALVGEAEAISALMRRTIVASNSADYPYDVIERLLARHRVVDVAAMMAARTVFVATVDHAIVGTGALEEDQLRGMFVDAARQGAGIGTGLVMRVEAHARAQGLDEIWLQASITARPFYRRLGYRDERFEGRDDGSVTIMRKSLYDSTGAAR